MVIGATNKLVSTAGAHFSEKELNQYESVLLVSAGFFCVALIRKEDNALSFLGYSVADTTEKPLELAELSARFFDQLPFSLSPCARIKISICGVPAMLVPEFLFDTRNSHELFRSHLGENAPAPESVALNADMQMLFYIQSDLKKILRTAAPSSEIFPLEYFLLSNTPAAEQNAHLRCILTPGRLLIIGHRNDRLVYVNSFEVRTEHDALYHTCNTALRAGFSMHDTTVDLSGWLNLSGDYFKHLARYFGTVRADQGHPTVKTEESMSGIHMHYFAPLTYMF